ncbi:MAG: InlB B-repeat-containing protein, partial [Ilumatobacteraceae bacterium]
MAAARAGAGGGGGGAGRAGGAGALSGAAGSGGAGLAPSWITATTARRLNIGEVSGSSAYFAGGGGGGGDYGGAAGAGGTGGGGRGSISTVAAVDGLDNSGGGGGGSGYHNTSGQSLGGDGGSGVVVLRYSTAAGTTSPTVDAAAVLNGTSQYFQVEEGSAFVSRATYTVESWIRPSAITCSSGAGCPFMLHDGDYAVSIKNSLFQVIAYHSGQGTAQTWTTKAYARLDRWQHVTLVRNGSSLQFYVNGDLMDSFTLSGSTRSTYAGYPLKIGFLYSAAEYFAGRVDQWRLWSTARTQGEIQTAMHEFTPSSATGLVAQYDFNGVSGSTVANSAPSAAANTALTAYGTPTYEDVKTTGNVENDTLLTFPRSYLTATGGWTVPNDPTALSVLAVGGGGGGGTDAGGGGGGGGIRYEDNAAATAGANVTVKVGTGGREGSWGAGWLTTAGQSSTVAWGARTYTGGGGNGGQSWNPPNTPLGGTGGTTSGNGSGTNGATGGNGPTSNCDLVFSQGWSGGNGPASSITGASTNYGGGGGGGFFLDKDTTSQASFTGRPGGAGGGGRGADWNLTTRQASAGFAGTDGLGGGGGGAHACGSTASHNRLSGHRTDGGAGGSGAVIIRYTPIETCAPVTYRHGVHKVYEFRTTSTCDWTVPTGVTALNYLVVGGGGGGGVYQSATGGAGGGGGGGGLLGGTGMAVTAGNVLTMRVGAGGAGGVMTTAGSGDGSGSSGADSQMSGTGISTVTAVGGGFGGGGPSFLGGNGGSGGGALGSAVTSASGGTGVAGPPRQGYNGGSNNTACGGERPAGGGGGAGGAGGDASCTGDQSGHGGVGLVSSITGVSRAYGGGGGGGASRGGAAAGVGGLGGGGAGGGRRGVDAIDGLGGGGGGAGYSTSVNVVVTGGAGGDGVIVVRHVDYTIAIVAGNNQTAMGNSTLPTNPKVVVRDAAGNGVDGVRVTFLADNGTLGSQSVVTSGGGFAETSWTLGATGSQSVTAMMDLVDSDWRIFTATATQASLTYNANNGTSPPAAQSVDAGTTVTVAGAGSMTRAGYTFAGWNTMADGSGTPRSAGSTFVLSSNVTLYAQWTANTLTVTYDSQGGTSIASGTTVTGGSIAASPGSPTRTGYTFAGWFNSTSGGSLVSFPFTHHQTASFTLYAQWTANSLTVTYDSQGGSAVSNSNTITGGSISAATAAARTPTRTGYAFAGWFTAASGGNAISFPWAHGQTSNFTLYAQWTGNTLTVTYDSQGGSSIAGGTTVSGGSIAASPGSPTRAGYSFAGWFTAASGGSAISFPWAHGQTSNFTLYA